MCPVEAVTAQKRIVNESGNDESYEPKKGRRKANLSLSGTNRSSLVRSGEIEIVIGHETETGTGKARDHGNATEIAIGITKGVIETRKGRGTTIRGTEIAIVSGIDQESGIVTEIGSGVGSETGTEIMNGEIATRTETMIGGIVIAIVTVTGTEEVVVLAGGRRGGTTGGMRDEKRSGRGKVVDEIATPIVRPGVKGRTRTMYRLIGIFQEDHDVGHVHCQHPTPSSTSLHAPAMLKSEANLDCSLPLFLALRLGKLPHLPRCILPSFVITMLLVVILTCTAWLEVFIQSLENRPLQQINALLIAPLLRPHTDMRPIQPWRVRDP
jgi:hypothetical protein